VEWLPWQDAALTAAGTAVATRTLGGRPSRAARAAIAWTRELTVMFALYALWQLAGDLSVGQPAGAIDRGRTIVTVERWFHLPSEASVQRMVIGHHELVRLMNYYYAGFHIAISGVCLVWLFALHRDRYPPVRNVLALVTGTSLLIALIPVAPPRLVPGLGIVDAGRLIGPSVYPATVKPGLDQLSAMPSVHVGWALIVAGAVIYALRTPWRWLAVLYPACTTWIVVATGNHFWADGVVEVLICSLAFFAVRAWMRRPAALPFPDRPLVSDISLETAKSEADAARTGVPPVP
jgi:PAP2 superfamily